MKIIMPILAITLFIEFASEALVECGNLCDPSLGRIAANVDVQAELNEGADVMATEQLIAKHLRGNGSSNEKRNNNS